MVEGAIHAPVLGSVHEIVVVNDKPWIKKALCAITKSKCFNAGQRSSILTSDPPQLVSALALKKPHAPVKLLLQRRTASHERCAVANVTRVGTLNLRCVLHSVNSERVMLM